MSSLTIKHLWLALVLLVYSIATFSAPRIGSRLNHPPTMNGDQVFAGVKNQTLRFVLSGASDVDKNSLSYVLVDSPSSGTLKNCLNNTPVLACEFAPESEYKGTVTFSYKAFDGTSYSTNVNRVTLKIDLENHAPVVGTNQDLSLKNDTSFKFNLSKGTDPDGDQIFYKLISHNGSGTLKNCLSGTSSLECEYVPATGVNETVNITYKVSDGLLESSQVATIKLRIGSVNHAPIMKGDQGFGTTKFTLAGASDEDKDTLTYTLVSPTNLPELKNCLNGTSNLNCEYVSIAKKKGPISFTYKANDGKEDSLNTSKVSIIAEPTSTIVITSISITNLQSFNERSLVVSGTLSSKVDKIEASIGDFSWQGNIEQDATFRIPDIVLFTGLNQVSIKAYRGELLVLNANYSLIYEPDSLAKVFLGLGKGSRLIVDAPSSPLNGLTASFSDGAINAPVLVTVNSFIDSIPTLPFKTTSVGTPFRLGPLEQLFNNKVVIEYPLDLSLLPDGGSIEDVKILAYQKEAWIELPIQSRNGNTIVFSIDSFSYDLYLPVYAVKPAKGELVVTTNYPGASLYLDGENQNKVTFANLQNIEAGNHKVKLYLDGYNEVVKDVTIPSDGGAVLDVALESSQGEPLKIEFDPSIPDTSTTTKSLFEFKVIVNSTQGIEEGLGIVTHNGEDYMMEPYGVNGFFGSIPLHSGPNTISVRVTPKNGRTTVSKAISVYLDSVLKKETSDSNSDTDLESLKSKAFVSGRSSLGNLVARLSWDNLADIDLHVIDPLGRHTSFSNRYAIPYGVLDRDDRDGLGPEVFTLSKLISGKYQFYAYHYSSLSAPAKVKLDIYLGQQRIYSGAETIGPLKKGLMFDYNSSGLSIYSASNEFNYIKSGTPSRFTTGGTESLIRFLTDAPSSIEDSSIQYKYRQLEPIITSYVYASERGRNVLLKLESVLPDDFYSTTSKPIKFEVIAYTDSGLVSPSFILVQDNESRLRQEYFDKKCLSSTFAIPVPGYEQIGGRNNFSCEYCSYESLSQGRNDYYEQGLWAIPTVSIDITNRVRRYISNNTISQNFRVQSSWRNPRNNDRMIRHRLNDLSQAGFSLEVRPMFVNRSSTTYEKEQMALCNNARKALPCNDYDTYLFGEHVQIEFAPDPSRVCKENHSCRYLESTSKE